MIEKVEETVQCKTPGLNNPKTYVLTFITFITYLVLIFTDLNKAQFYKIPYRGNPHREIELLLSFNYFSLFKPNAHTEKVHFRKPNEKKFLFEIADKTSFYIGSEVFSFETNDKVVKYSSEIGSNDNKFPFAHSEENIFYATWKI